jgi:fructose-specific phosphotransferase system IIC component
MISIVFWAPVGGIISSSLAYPYGALAMVFAYLAGFVVSSFMTGLLTYPKYTRLGDAPLD